MARLPIDGGTLQYRDTGDGQPIVFLHGGWMDRDAWSPQVESFADSYRTIAIDLRGHGRTGPTDASRYTVETYLEDVERLLDHLGIERPILCGLSLGAMIVQAYLDRHPAGARAAILCGPVRSMPPITVPAAMKSAFRPLPVIDASLRTIGPVATFRTMLGWIRATTGGPWLTVDRRVRSRVLESVGSVESGEFRKIFDALYRFDPPDLSHVTTPTLVVAGEHEAVPVRRQGRAIAGAVGNGGAITLPDSAHLANLDNPSAFDAACGRFLADHVGA